MERSHENQLGYLYNLSFALGVPSKLGQYLTNHLGDPYAESQYEAEGLCSPYSLTVVFPQPSEAMVKT